MTLFVYVHVHVCFFLFVCYLIEYTDAKKVSLLTFFIWSGVNLIFVKYWQNVKFIKFKYYNKNIIKRVVKTCAKRL